MQLLPQNQKTAFYAITQDPRPYHAGQATRCHKAELDDLAAGEPGAIVLRTEAAGAAVQQFGAHFSGIALGHSRAELETDFSFGRPPWLAPLLHVLAGSGL